MRLSIAHERLEAGDDSHIEAVLVRVVLAGNRRETERAVIYPKLEGPATVIFAPPPKFRTPSGSLLVLSRKRP
jgi:hypothetical protein